MKKQLLFTSFILFISFSVALAQSNLLIDNSYTVEEMVMDFFDNSGVNVSNVTHTGDSTSIAFFDAGGTDLGVDAGIVFCNGNIHDVNNSSDYFASSSLFLSGDNDINLMSQMGGGSISSDAILIEFDFTVSESDTLNFNYVFGSEEYPEFVFSSFNDAFAFFISGPGISGPFSNGADNFSTIPGSSEEVAINSVNDSINSLYYMDYSMGQHIIYDGLTVPLPAEFYAMKDSIYHVKMVIADRGDSSYDSGIFLSFNSLGQDSLLTPPTSFLVATNGNGLQVSNESKYARTYLWDFGNGETSTYRNPGPVYFANAGDYTVSLTTQNYCCTDSYSTTVTADFSQVLSATVQTTNNPLSCANATNAAIDLQISGGILPYTSIDWFPTIPDLNNVGAGTYNYTVTDQVGTVITGEVTITAPDEILLGTQTTDENSGQSNGMAEVIPSGGTPPFTFLWSNGATTPMNNNLISGNYTVTVSDTNGCTSVAMVEVGLVVAPMVANIITTNNPLDCFGDNNASLNIVVTGGEPPYQYIIYPNGADLNNLSAGTYTIIVQYVLGTSLSNEVVITQPDEITLATDSTPATGAGTDGTATVIPSGGTMPFTFLWSNGATTETAQNLLAGDYTVEVTDANDCMRSTLVTVESVTSLLEKNDFEITLFPNPVKDQFRLEWSVNDELQKIEVFNVVGQAIPVSFEKLTNGRNVKLDKTISNGTYYIRVQMSDGSLSTARFIVN